MKIIGIEVTPLSAPLQKVSKLSFGILKVLEDVLIRIYTDTGITGLGEAVCVTPYYTGESQDTILAVIRDYIFPRVLKDEDPFNIEKIVEQMDALVYGHGVAKSAIDSALYDIVGRSLNVPVYQLIGGLYRRKIDLRYSVSMDSPERMAAEAVNALQAGFQGIKMKAGINLREDIDNLAAIRKAVGPDVEIDIDANQAYVNAGIAIPIIKQMEEYAPILVEQPLRRDDFEGAARVTGAVDAPIGACEMAVTPREMMRVIRMGAADWFNLKIGRSGGFYRGKQAAAMAEAAGMFCVGSMLLGFGIELAANAHFAASTAMMNKPNGYGSGVLKRGGKFDTRDLEGDIVSNTPKIENGFLLVPDGPGLGVELHEEAVQKYTTTGKTSVLMGRKP